LAYFTVEMDLPLFNRVSSVFNVRRKKIMPTDLIHRIGIAAPAEAIYRTLTTEDGLRAWWTTDDHSGMILPFLPFMDIHSAVVLSSNREQAA
jgi:hypothetical protein